MRDNDNADASTHIRRTCHHPRIPGGWALAPGLQVAALIALLVGASQIGARAMGTTLPIGPSSAGNRHCVAQLGAGIPTMRCFSSLNAAVAAATDGRVRLLAGTTGAGLLTIPLNDGAGYSDYHVVSIEWTQSDYKGASLTWQTPSPCGDYASSSMPRGWNDAIRSVAQYSGCATTLYWDVSFGGASTAIDVNASVPDLGNFDANVSSQKWCPTLGCT